MNTGDKTLDRKYFEIQLAVRSTRSTSVNSEVVHTFRINFIDECYDT